MARVGSMLVKTLLRQRFPQALALVLVTACAVDDNDGYSFGTGGAGSAGGGAAGAAQTAGTAGAAASNAGGSAGAAPSRTGGTSGSGGSAPTGGGANDEEPAKSSPPGKPCDDEGELVCAGEASDSVLVCTGGQLLPSTTCERGSLCDSADPGCAPIAPGCERLSPGGAFCDGNTRFVCGPDLVSIEDEECPGRCRSGACVDAACGDGVMQSGEGCDDGNDVDTDDCPSTCAAAACGDGFVYPRAEECDDGNDVDTDDCPSTCTSAVCGDGFTLEGSEECDDGNLIDTDACLKSCKAAACGDGAIHAGKEACDDGNDVTTDDCPVTCKDAVCGDGFVWKGEEECDDGNVVSGDGCASDCEAEPIKLSLGVDHSCALLSDGRLKCWGDNTYGQVGPGTDLAVGDSATEMGANLDSILDGVTDVGSGRYHTCAVQDGRVWCWGANQTGQLGPAAPYSVTSALISPPVAVALPRAATSVCASWDSNFALLDDQTVRFWGLDWDEDGVVGVQTMDFSETVSSISCGAAGVCAALSSGNVECWGTETLTSSYPTPLRTLVGDRAGAPVVELAPGDSHVCVRHANGQVRCWGSNDSGQFGEGHTDSRAGNQASSVTWPAAAVGSGVQSLASGYYATCAVLLNGGAKCWGFAQDAVLGQPSLAALGNLGDEPADVPSQFDTISLGDGEKVKSIATSGYHSCAILSSGKIKCWGSNRRGQLGIGMTNAVIGTQPSHMGNALRYTNLD